MEALQRTGEGQSRRRTALGAGGGAYLWRWRAEGADGREEFGCKRKGEVEMGRNEERIRWRWGVRGGRGPACCAIVFCGMYSTKLTCEAQFELPNSARLWTEALRGLFLHRWALLR
jgi:hypothetical protein